MSAIAPTLFWVYSGSLAGSLNRATWLETTRHLSGLGWNVSLVANDIPAKELGQDVRFIRLARPRLYLLGYLIFHLLLLREIWRAWEQIDVLMFHQDAAFFLLPLRWIGFLRRSERPKLVMDVRTVSMNNSTWRAKLQAAYFAAMYRYARLLADGQTAITPGMAEAVGMPQRQLLGTWPSGAELRPFAEAAAERQWPGSTDDLRLIYIGALEPERNLAALCAAVRKVQTEGCHVALDLVGAGTQRAELEAIAREAPAGVITVRSAVARDLVPRLLAQAHLGVLPFPDRLEFRVSSPVKLFEYLASGLPILATHVSCHSDVLSGTKCVFWADHSGVESIASAIRLASLERDALPAMGREAAIVARHWTWEASATKLSAALAQVIH